MGKGVLHITLEGCKGIQDDGWFGKKDPYAIVTCGANKHKTPVATGGGKNPVWNSKAEFTVDGSETLEVKIYDDDVVSDDFLGSAQLSIKSGKQEVPIKTKAGKENGKLIVDMTFTGEGGHSEKGEHKSEEHKSGEHKSGEKKSGEHKSGEKKSGEHKSGEKKEKKKKEKKHGSGSSSSSSDSD